MSRSTQCRSMNQQQIQKKIYSERRKRKLANKLKVSQREKRLTGAGMKKRAESKKSSTGGEAGFWNGGLAGGEHLHVNPVAPGRVWQWLWSLRLIAGNPEQEIVTGARLRTCLLLEPGPGNDRGANKTWTGNVHKQNDAKNEGKEVS